MNKKFILNLIVLSLLFLCAFGYAINLLYRFVKPNYKTEVVYNFSYSDVLSLKSVIIRDEKPIYINDSGYLYYLVDDGSAVSQKTVLANIYSDSNSIDLCNKLSSLENNIEIIDSILDKISNVSNSKDIEKEINKYSLKSLDESYLNDIDNTKMYLQYYLAANTLSSYEYNSLNYQLDKYKEEYLRIKNIIPSEKSKLYSTSDGYFSKEYDGLETLLVYNLEELKFDNVKKIIEGSNQNTKKNKNIIGKSISSHKSYFIIPISEEQIATFKKYKTFKLDFDNYEDIIEVSLINVIKNNEDYYAIAECDLVNSFITNTRVNNISVKFNSYNGLKINKISLRNYQGKEGVFVKTGNLIEFKPVGVLYSGNNFYIVSSNNLKQYDEVIIEGQNLYDGKII